MGFIPEDTLQSILEAADLRQVVQEFVPLKKRGKNWVGLCPFHPDKDPSFTVNEEKQIFYCFGCGEGGNVFKFLMKIQGLSFVDAVKALAERYGITIREAPLSQAQKKKKELSQQLLEINHLACQYFMDLLEGSVSAQAARAYLQERGLDSHTIGAFQIGWSQDSWDGLIKFLQEHGVDLELAEKVGLIIKRTGASGYYDRFRGRIIFPIHDHRGDIVAFGGRIIGLPGQEEQPKYINSPESPIYHKGRTLFGLFQNKASIRKAGYGLVVEGYMDVISLYQFGIKEAIAPLGTALTEEQATRMRGITKEWILLFDGDEAGLKAAQRALPILYKFDLRPRVLTLPKGEDPDSFVRANGADSLRQLMQDALSGIDFLIETGNKVNGLDTEGRLATVEMVLESIIQVTDPVRKSLLISHVAQRLGVREESLWETIQKKTPYLKPVAKRSSQDSPAPLVDKPFKKQNRAQEKVIGFLLSYPRFIQEFMELSPEIWLENRRLLDLWQAMVNVYSMTGQLNLTDLYNFLENQPEIRAVAMKLASDFPPCEDLIFMANDLKTYCIKQKKKALRMQLIQQMREMEQEEIGEELLRHFQSLM